MFEVELAAVPQSLMELRQELRGWLDQPHVPGTVVDDLLLAVTEAATNAIEHGHDDTGQGTVTVTASMAAGRVWLTVVDSGTWRPPTPQPTHHGRGLPIVRTVMDETEIRPSSGGTSVFMARSLDEQRSREPTCPT